MTHPLLKIAAQFHAGTPRGITSVCSAHPLVIEAALRHAKATGVPPLIEATCNQVNQDGGYTGMTPGDFRSFVEAIAERVGYPSGRIILGGDHLGPNPWKHLSPDTAMEKAEALVAAYSAAGFTKLHLDTSIGCAGEPVALDDETTALRAARLARIAEKNKGTQPPVYVIGTEVPVPGGALEALDELALTSPQAVAKTYGVHRKAFAAAGVEDAFSRVIALVVQPGVEFGHTNVIGFDPEKAQDLSAALSDLPGIVFEAHSTDYQEPAGLAALVRAGFAILKVGPWLTFRMREALYGLDSIADVLDGHPPRNRVMSTMENLMAASPANWDRYYHGEPKNLWVQRHFSYSDRIRYYWPEQQAADAVTQLLSRLENVEIPAPLLSQYLPGLNVRSDARSIVLAAIEDVLSLYARAAMPDTASRRSAWNDWA